MTAVMEQSNPSQRIIGNYLAVSIFPLPLACSHPLSFDSCEKSSVKMMVKPLTCHFFIYTQEFSPRGPKAAFLGVQTAVIGFPHFLFFPLTLLR